MKNVRYWRTSLFPPVAATPLFASLQSRDARWITLAYNLFISAAGSKRRSCKAASVNVVVRFRALWCGFIKSLFSILFIFHIRLSTARTAWFIFLVTSLATLYTAADSFDSNQVLGVACVNPVLIIFLSFQSSSLPAVGCSVTLRTLVIRRIIALAYIATKGRDSAKRRWEDNRLMSSSASLVQWWPSSRGVHPLKHN